MNLANLIAAATFLLILAAGLAVSLLRGLKRNRPEARIQERMSALARSYKVMASTVDAKDADTLRRKISDNRLRVWMERRKETLMTVSGPRGLLIVTAVGGLALIGAVLAGVFLPLPTGIAPLLPVAAPALACVMAYRHLIKRFKDNFLVHFPDTLDLIIRAVRAGVPVVQAIRIAGDEAQEPVRAEFRRMADALRIGLDFKESLDQATERLRIPDFSFFAVCLLLQRETGGALGEVLENLSNIIRSRRDLRLKARALTAEGKITSRFIAAVPFIVAGMLFSLNRDYVIVLFNTEAGHKILTLAAVLLAIGLGLVNKLGKLEA
jgi:tight adherence protein B